MKYDEQVIQVYRGQVRLTTQYPPYGKSIKIKIMKVELLVSSLKPNE